MPDVSAATGSLPGGGAAGTPPHSGMPAGRATRFGSQSSSFSPWLSSFCQLVQSVATYKVLLADIKRLAVAL